MLDDGRLTDGHGRVVDFRNTLIILTSNLGSEFLSALAPDEPIEAARDNVMAQVRAAFRPEFLNRLDEIILFERLQENQMAAIVDIQLGHLHKLLQTHNIHLELSDTARYWLAQKGYDPAYGARPLKRVIQRELQDRLASMIIDGDVKEGAVIHLESDKNGLVFSDRPSVMV